MFQKLLIQISLSHYGNKLKALLRQELCLKGPNAAGTQSISVELSGTVFYIPKGLLIWLLVTFVSGAHRQP